MTTDLLLVEDDGDHAALVEAVFDRASISVRVVTTGRGALEALTDPDDGRGLPDAVLLDVDLPDVSGLDVLRELARTGVTQAVPVIVYTASSDAGRRARALELGASAFVQKPTDFSELVPVIREHLRRSRRRRFG